MRWKNRRSSNNVQDRRGQRAPMRMGGMSSPILGLLLRMLFSGGKGSKMGLLLIVGGIFLMFKMGINPLALLGGQTGGAMQQTTATSPEEDELAAFVKVVLAETEDTWNRIFAAEGRDYPEPTLVLFRGQVKSACGLASAASGPFYCPGDSQVYIDLGFYEELRRKFEAPGDFAQAYVIAHEVGHHIQNLTGVLPRFNQQRRSMSKAEENQMSIRVELQADCYAGVWAHDTAKNNLLEEGDIDEALNAAEQIGDDAIQERIQGYVVPESFNHGTSQQRRTWFKRGFQNGDVDQCDTFSGPV